MYVGYMVWIAVGSFDWVSWFSVVFWAAIHDWCRNAIWIVITDAVSNTNHCVNETLIIKVSFCLFFLLFFVFVFAFVCLFVFLVLKLINPGPSLTPSHLSVIFSTLMTQSNKSAFKFDKQKTKQNPKVYFIYYTIQIKINFHQQNINAWDFLW